MADDDLQRYFEDQDAPRRSAVFDLAVERGIKETGMKLADVMANEKLYNRILKAAQDAEDKNVYGHDFKKTRKGEPIEQGQGAPGHETANHFAAMLANVRRGLESHDTYKASVNAFVERDPDRAKQLRIHKVA